MGNGLAPGLDWSPRAASGLATTAPCGAPQVSAPQPPNPHGSAPGKPRAVQGSGPHRFVVCVTDGDAPPVAAQTHNDPLVSLASSRPLRGPSVHASGVWVGWADADGEWVGSGREPESTTDGPRSGRLRSRRNQWVVGSDQKRSAAAPATQTTDSCGQLPFTLQILILLSRANRAAAAPAYCGGAQRLRPAKSARPPANSARSARFGLTGRFGPPHDGALRGAPRVSAPQPPNPHGSARSCFAIIRAADRTDLSSASPTGAPLRLQLTRTTTHWFRSQTRDRCAGLARPPRGPGGGGREPKATSHGPPRGPDGRGP